MSGTATISRFECPDRRRSFLDRFRGERAKWHQPQHGSSYQFQCEWPQFPGVLVNHEANDCVHCRQPIVRVVGDVWSVRWATWWADETEPAVRA